MEWKDGRKQVKQTQEIVLRLGAQQGAALKVPEPRADELQFFG